ncbi:hypothetical protein MOB65_19840 [Bacillus inaquosorum]|uniref:hypothetical protein n=1 Tax=Bacillus inaquosorum TaxID=483913 RepID=UPI00227EEBDD|nr:hypothetical protein [Bacillus inaquosorum]MCY7911108.1 hypothetical protein [Bacillus inaquosorum]
MIIDYNFFGFEHGGCVWDTPVCTDMLDELQLNEGIYDEVYVNLDTTIPDNTSKPTVWSLSTIMDAKFTGDLDAGSVGAEGFKVTKILLFRSLVGTNQWDAVAQFEYDKEYNVYDYIDRYVQNGSTYQYAVVPVANEILGDRLASDPIKAEYEGIFLTDKNENRRLEYDISLGDVLSNTASSVTQPINGKYPIIIFGTSNYRSGNLSVLPLSKSTVSMAGERIDKFAEQINRQEWLSFLNNCKAKVLRMDNGVLMLVVTQNATVSHKEGDILRDLASISFDFVEIGELTFDSLIKNDLIPSAERQKMTYDDYGGIISG